MLLVRHSCALAAAFPRPARHGSPASLAGPCVKIEGAPWFPVRSRRCSCAPRGPRRALGVVVAVLGITVETLAVYPLAHVANVVSLGVVYLIAVVVVSTYWGIWLGLRDGAGERRRLQLLPSAAGRAADARRQPQLGRARGLLVVAAATGRRRRARARPCRRGRAAPPRGRPRDRDGARCCSAAPTSTTRSRSPRSASRRAIGAVLGRDRARRGRGRRAPRRLPAAPTERGRRAIGTLVLPAALARAERDRIAERIVPALQSVLAAALRPRRARGRGRRDRRAAAQRRDEDGAAALGLPRPAHAADRDHQRRRRARPRSSRRRAGRRGPRGRARRRPRGWPRSSRSCSTSRGCRPGAAEQHVGRLLARGGAGRGDRARRAGAASCCASRSTRSAAPARRRRPARARLREPDRERAALRAGKPVLVRARRRRRARAGADHRPGPGIRAGELERIFLPFYRSPEPAREPPGLRARPGDRQGLHRGQRRADQRSSRCPDRARASSSSCRSSRRRAPSRRPPDGRRAHPRLRRRPADPAGAAAGAARRRLRGADQHDRPRRRSTARRSPGPHAAIIDLMLPDRPGIEVCRELRSLERAADHRALGRHRRADQDRGAPAAAPTTT